MFEPSSPLARWAIRELLAGAAYAAGHQPDDDLVIVLLSGGRRVCRFLHFDLEAHPRMVLAELLMAAREHGAERSVVIGYGDDAVEPVMAVITAVLDQVLPVEASVTVVDGQYRCLCDDPVCPSREPAPFDLSTAIVTAHMTARGRLVPPPAEHIRALLDPDLGAQARTAAQLARLRPAARPPVALLGHLLRSAKAGVPLSDADMAGLAVALLDPVVLRLAWLSSGEQLWARQLWLQVVRRVDEPHAGAPASLLAWCAWRRGETLLASLALRRARQAGAGNELADVVAELLRCRVSAADVPWTPLTIPSRPGRGTADG